MHGLITKKESNMSDKNISNYLKYLCIFVLGFCLGMWAAPAHASDENGEAVCLAKNIYFEAGNQPVAGKIAVAQVVINRVESQHYPDTICGVVYQARWGKNWKGTSVPIRNMCQFSWFCDGKSDEPVDSATWMLSLSVASSVIWNSYGDITEGSTHYHNDSVYPYWADSLRQTVIINNHLFYK
jgi:spore germination cell wall hydrolase CwlJ-like protein